jgi:uncharacterized membrane protein YhaH (DUF805 family)
MTSSTLSQPLYGATFGQAVSRFFTKYATFSGRASRSEFWWSWLFFLGLVTLIGFPIGAIVGLTGTPTSSGGVQLTAPGVIALVVGGLLVLGLIIPRISVTVRRLHDADYSGWFLLLVLIPQIGGLIVLILNILPSKPEGARFDRSINS